MDNRQKLWIIPTTMRQKGVVILIFDTNVRQSLSAREKSSHLWRTHTKRAKKCLMRVRICLIPASKMRIIQRKVSQPKRQNARMWESAHTGAPPNQSRHTPENGKSGTQSERQETVSEAFTKDQERNRKAHEHAQAITVRELSASRRQRLERAVEGRLPFGEPPENPTLSGIRTDDRGAMAVINGILREVHLEELARLRRVDHSVAVLDHETRAAEAHLYAVGVTVGELSESQQGWLLRATGLKDISKDCRVRDIERSSQAVDDAVHEILAEVKEAEMDRLESGGKPRSRGEIADGGGRSNEWRASEFANNVTAGVLNADQRRRVCEALGAWTIRWDKVISKIETRSIEARSAIQEVLKEVRLEELERLNRESAEEAQRGKVQRENEDQKVADAYELAKAASERALAITVGELDPIRVIQLRFVVGRPLSKGFVVSRFARGDEMASKLINEILVEVAQKELERLTAEKEK